MKKGFSLVELSIVLVILGLLTGGILAGQSLIRASELRSAGVEWQRYQTAIQAFRDKYFAIPGDFNAGTRVWGRLSSASWCTTNSSAAVNASTGVCDGAGDGVPHAASAVSQSGENLQFWRELALAGLIEGSYTGLASAGSVSEADVGKNMPNSKLNNAIWNVQNFGGYSSGDASNYAGNYGNMFTLGGYVAGAWPYIAVETPAEAWNFDTKYDDGKPGTGQIIIGNRTTCANSTSTTDYASSYNLSSTAKSCVFYFMRQF